MKINYDKITDAIYFRIKASKVFKTIKMQDRLLADVDKKGNILGIELLEARSQLGKSLIPTDIYVRIPAIS